jgi:hypothetical protein
MGITNDNFKVGDVVRVIIRKGLRSRTLGGYEKAGVEAIGTPVTVTAIDDIWVYSKGRHFQKRWFTFVKDSDEATT